MKIRLHAPLSFHVSGMRDFSNDRLQRFWEALMARDAVVAVFLLGFRSRGTPKGVGEVDVGIMLHPEICQARHFALRLELLACILELLGTTKVELVLLHFAPIHMAHRIVSHGRLLLDRDPRCRAAFEADRMERISISNLPTMGKGQAIACISKDLFWSVPGR